MEVFYFTFLLLKRYFSLSRKEENSTSTKYSQFGVWYIYILLNTLLTHKNSKVFYVDYIKIRASKCNFWYRNITKISVHKIIHISFYQLSAHFDKNKNQRNIVSCRMKLSPTLSWSMAWTMFVCWWKLREDLLEKSLRKTKNTFIKCFCASTFHFVWGYFFLYFENIPKTIMSSYVCICMMVAIRYKRIV